MAEPTPTDPAARRQFLTTQLHPLAAHGVVVVGVPQPPFDVIRAQRDAEGAWMIALGGRDQAVAFSDTQVGELGRLGFTHGEVSWRVPVPGPDEAADAIEAVLTTVLGLPADAAIDLRHGSTAAEHEAEQQLLAMRAQLEPIVRDMTSAEPVIDDDGDYVVVVDHSQVYVAPRAMPGRLPVVRVFAITNAGVQMTPELGMYLARLNFSLMFGRFSLDAEHGAVWLDETLLGQHVTDDELRFIISMVAATADEWDEKIAAVFGGQVRTPVDAQTTAARQSKPGEGGYL